MELQLAHLPLLAADAANSEGPSYFGLVFYVVLELLIIGILVAMVRKGLHERIFKNPMTQAAEQMYLFIESMCSNIIGPDGKRYIPFIGTLWLVIFVGNSISLFFASAATADLSFNLAMAIIAVGYVQFEGVRGHANHLMHDGMSSGAAWGKGLLLHLRHFAGPKMGKENAIEAVVAIVMPLLLLPIEVISELMKNLSLSLRLYGNIHGGHVAVEALNEVGRSIYLPLGGLLLIVKLLTVIVQALVFTLLTCVYISLVTHHEPDDSEQTSLTPAQAH